MEYHMTPDKPDCNANRYATILSRPDSRSDPISGSEPVSGCETIYWDFLFYFYFFFRAELIPVGIQTIFVVTKNHSHIQILIHVHI